MDGFELEGATDESLRKQARNAAFEQNTHGLDIRTTNNSQVGDKLMGQKDSFDPINCVLTTIFKIFAITLYLTLRIRTDSFLGVFVGVVLLISFDFWVTKNLTGRKLVGLRWWGQIDQQGQEQWIFESRNPNRVPHPVNQSIFWFSLAISLLFWVLNLVLCVILINLFWFGLGFFSLLLTSINFVSYFKCRGEHQKKLSQLSSKIGINMGSRVF